MADGENRRIIDMVEIAESFFKTPPQPRNKKNCDPNCPYDCEECKREGKWLKAFGRAERKEAKKLEG